MGTRAGLRIVAIAIFIATSIFDLTQLISASPWYHGRPYKVGVDEIASVSYFLFPSSLYIPTTLSLSSNVLAVVVVNVIAVAAILAIWKGSFDVKAGSGVLILGGYIALSAVTCPLVWLRVTAVALIPGT